MTQTMEPKTTFITDEMLNRFRERAPRYDRENAFFQEDWDEVKASGFLTALVPTEFGGAGWNLSRYSREIGRMAQYAPATALAVNMHSYWIGIAAEMRRMGDPSLEWLLKEAAAGEIFAAGHAESGQRPPRLPFDRESGAGGGRLQDHRAQDVREPDTGVDALRLPLDDG